MNYSRYALVGVIATPLLFIAGAGAALFWTLGVTGKYFFKNFFQSRGYCPLLNSSELI